MATLVYEYAVWHYGTALRDQVRIASNFVWFCKEFFSFSILVRTFFSPFHRLDEGYAKGFRPGAWAETFLLNMLMRIVGAGARTVVLIVGALVTSLVCIGAVLVFVVWLLAPIFLLFLVVSSFVFFLL